MAVLMRAPPRSQLEFFQDDIYPTFRSNTATVDADAWFGCGLRCCGRRSRGRLALGFAV
jgi:hypothetical protein